MPELSVAQSAQNIHTEPETALRLLNELAAGGVRFTLCYERSKRPIGTGWQRRGKGKRAAAAHLAAGGNVGILGGSGGVYVVDLDKDAAARLAQLPTTKQAKRDNALGERVKCIFHTSGPLPRSRKDHDAGIEILALASNAVILGTHESGAAIYLTDDPIAEMSAAECDAFYAACGGRSDGTPAEESPLATTSANARDLLHAAIVAGTPGHRHTTGFELARRMRDAGYSTPDARAVMLDYQVTVQNTGNHPYTEREALATLTGTYSHKAKTKGVPSSKPRNPIHAVIDDLKRRVVTGDISLSANMEQTFLAALDVMHSAESIEDVQMPTGEISHRANMARPTVWRHMRELAELGLLRRVYRGNWTEASVYSLGDVAMDKMKHPSGNPGPVPLGGVSFCPGDELLLAYEALGHMPLTESGARVDVRLAKNDEQTTWSFGTSARRLLAHLAVSPAADAAELAARARVSPKTTYRKLKSLIAAGIVVDDVDLRLADDWQERMNDIAPALVTFGRWAIRAVAYAKQRIAIHNHMLELYETRPLRRRFELADMAEDALKQAHKDLAYWQPFVHEAYLQRVEWAREHLDLSADAVPPCSLNSNMARPDRIVQPVFAHGRPLLPNVSKIHAGKNRSTAWEQLQALAAKELLTGDELALARGLAARVGVQIETVRMELN